MSAASAVFFVAPRRVEVRAVDVEPPGPNQVQVRTMASGISAGTEMLAYRGELDAEMVADETITSLSGGSGYPFRYGYSAVGEVETAGSRFDPGALVFAFHPHQDRFVVDVADVVDLTGTGVRPRDAALFPLVETALQITLDAGTLDDRVVVVAGLGPLGLLVALLLRRGGAQVIASEPLEWRRDAASSLGIAAFDPSELADVIAEATGGGIPLSIDVTGSTAALAGLLELAAHEGEVLVASWFGNKPVPLPLGGPFHRRRLTIRSTQVSTIPSRLRSEWTVERRRAEAAHLLSELPLSAIATHDFAFGDAPAAYAAVDDPPAGLLHAALVYE